MRRLHVLGISHMSFTHRDLFSTFSDQQSLQFYAKITRAARSKILPLETGSSSYTDVSRTAASCEERQMSSHRGHIWYICTLHEREGYHGKSCEAFKYSRGPSPAVRVQSPWQRSWLPMVRSNQRTISLISGRQPSQTEAAASKCSNRPNQLCSCQN